MTVFYGYNQVDNARITATNTDASYPASNLQDHRRTKVFRSTTNSCSITFDILTPEPVDSILLTENPSNGFGFTTPITIEANNTSDFDTVSPAFSTTITASDIDAKFGFAYKEFSSQEYRFWRLSFTGSSYVEVSNVFIGSKIDFTTTDLSRELSFGEQDLADFQTNRYGQKFIDEIGRIKTLSGSFTYMNKTEMDTFFEMYDYNRSTKPIYLRMDCSIFNDTDRISGMYFFDEKPLLSHVNFGLWNIDFALTEAK